MPLKLYDHMSHDYFISAKRNHLVLGELGEGQTCTVFSADPRTVQVSPDTTPRKGPDGSVSIASGKVSIASPAASPNIAIVVTSRILEGNRPHARDGNGVAIPDCTDTVMFVPIPVVERRNGAADRRPAPFVERRTGAADTRIGAVTGEAEGSLFGVPAA